jgi:FixJ family two-component response regulator
MTSAGRMIGVVDDDAAVCDSTRLLLEVCGFNVCTYRNAADFLRSGPPIACLIVDYQMPSMNGLELVSELRKRGQTVPTIMITATTNPEIERRATALNVRSVLNKPLSSGTLVTAVQDAMERSCVPC